MADLEKRIRDIAAIGNLTYVSLVPVAGKGGIVWIARVSPANRGNGEGTSHFDGKDADPVKALHAALDGIKMPKTRAKPASDNKKYDWDVHEVNER